MSDHKSNCHDRTVSASAILDSVQSLASQDPGAFGNLVVEILWKLSELDRDAYEWLMSMAISQELYAAGLKIALEQAKEALSLGHRGRVEERVTAIEGWICTIEYLGSRERFKLLSAGELDSRPTNAGRNTYLM